MVVAGGSGICRHVLRTAAIFATATTFAACSASRPSVQPIAPISSAPPATSAPAASQIGVASWYGPGFNGHATSSGEIYNQDDFTAASLSCPLGSRVMVTNLDNGRSVEVRINDHGPYVKGRKIDLSRKAATVLGMVGPGTARVRLDLLSVPSVSAPIGSALRYFVQVGSFANSSHADHLRSRLAEYYSDVRVDQVDAGSHRFYRVRMGAFPTRVEAQARAEKTSHFGLPIIILSE